MRHTRFAAVLGVLLALPLSLFSRTHDPAYEIKLNGVTKVQMAHLYKEDPIVLDVDLAEAGKGITNLVAGQNVVVEDVDADGRTKRVSVTNLLLRLKADMSEYVPVNENWTWAPDTNAPSFWLSRVSTSSHRPVFSSADGTWSFPEIGGYSAEPVSGAADSLSVLATYTNSARQFTVTVSRSDATNTALVTTGRLATGHDVDTVRAYAKSVWDWTYESAYNLRAAVTNCGQEIDRLDSRASLLEYRADNADGRLVAHWVNITNLNYKVQDPVPYYLCSEYAWPGSPVIRLVRDGGTQLFVLCTDDRYHDAVEVRADGSTLAPSDSITQFYGATFTVEELSLLPGEWVGPFTPTAATLDSPFPDSCGGYGYPEYYGRKATGFELLCDLICANRGILRRGHAYDENEFNFVRFAGFSLAVDWITRDIRRAQTGVLALGRRIDELQAPDFTPVNTQLVATVDSRLSPSNSTFVNSVVAVSPPTSLEPAINYTDSATNDLSTAVDAKLDGKLSLSGGTIDGGDLLVKTSGSDVRGLGLGYDDGRFFKLVFDNGNLFILTYNGSEYRTLNIPYQTSGVFALRSDIPGSVAPGFEPGRSYGAYDTVSYGGNLYRRKTSGTDYSWDQSHWTSIVSLSDLLRGIDNSGHAADWFADDILDRWTETNSVVRFKRGIGLPTYYGISIDAGGSDYPCISFSSGDSIYNAGYLLYNRESRRFEFTGYGGSPSGPSLRLTPGSAAEKDNDVLMKRDITGTPSWFTNSVVETCRAAIRDGVIKLKVVDGRVELDE